MCNIKYTQYAKMYKIFRVNDMAISNKSKNYSF